MIAHQEKSAVLKMMNTHAKFVMKQEIAQLENHAQTINALTVPQMTNVVLDGHALKANALNVNQMMTVKVALMDLTASLEKKETIDATNVSIMVIALRINGKRLVELISFVLNV